MTDPKHSPHLVTFTLMRVGLVGIAISSFVNVVAIQAFLSYQSTFITLGATLVCLAVISLWRNRHSQFTLMNRQINDV